MAVAHSGVRPRDTSAGVVFSVVMLALKIDLWSGL